MYLQVCYDSKYERQDNQLLRVRQEQPEQKVTCALDRVFNVANQLAHERDRQAFRLGNTGGLCRFR